MTGKKQFITDAAGKKLSVVLPLRDYNKMMKELDEYTCIKASGKTHK